MLKISNSGGKYYTSHHLAVINVSLIPCIQHLQWGDVILSTYARTRYLGLRVNCHCRCWCLSMHTNGWWSQVTSKILNVFQSLRATFAQFLLHGFYLLLPGYAFFSHLLGSTCNSQSISLNTWSTVSKHFWCNQSLQLPKAQTKPTKSRDFDKNAQVISWIPFVTKVMQWMVANRIHGSRHLGVETTYSKATPEGRNKLTT